VGGRSGRTAIPKSEKEELLYYKGIYQIRQLIGHRIEVMQRLNETDKQIAAQVAKIKSFISWRELGEILGMTEAQAKSYLSPLMSEVASDEK
jgi:hypothetical protein